MRTPTDLRAPSRSEYFENTQNVLCIIGPIIFRSFVLVFDEKFRNPRAPLLVEL